MKTNKRYAVILTMAILAGLCSCKKIYRDNTEIIGDMTDFYFCSRECNFIWADNARSDKEVKFALNGITGSTEVDFSRYLLEFNTCNVCLDSINFIPNYKQNYLDGKIDCVEEPPFYVLSNLGKVEVVEGALCDEPNVNIERHLKRVLYDKKKRNSNRIATRLDFWDSDGKIPLDYRITPISGIDIKSTADLCGIKAGESINSLFSIFAYNYSPHYDFIITADEEVIVENIRDITIPEFLSYDPMAPAQMFLRFRDGISISSPVKASFTVTLTRRDGKVLTAATHDIILKP